MAGHKKKINKKITYCLRDEDKIIKTKHGDYRNMLMAATLVG